MIKVSQKCETLDEGIKFLMAGAKADYVAMSTSYGKKELTGWALEQTVQDNGVFCFIVKEDFKHFKKGDILKAAGYNAPALNSPRGNVLTGNYPIQWTGPLYLK